MGLISNTNSDLLNLLSGAAPSAKSSSITGTSPVPETGAFQKLLLLFPSTEVAAEGQNSSALTVPAPMLPPTQPGSDSLLMVTPTDLGSLRLFSQDGSLYTVQYGQQTTSSSSLSELERLEQAVAELQTVTLYVPPETRVNPAIVPTEGKPPTQLSEVSSETLFENITADATQPTIWSSAQDLQVFPRNSVADLGTVADPRVGQNAVLGTDFHAAGMDRISAAQAAFSDRLVSIKGAAGTAIPADSPAIPVTASAAKPAQSVPAGSIHPDSAETPVLATNVLTGSDAAKPSMTESLAQRLQSATLPAANTTADVPVSSAIAATSGDKVPSAPKVAGLAGGGEVAAGSSLRSAAESPVLGTASRGEVRVEAAAASESAAVVKTGQQLPPGEAVQPLAAGAGATTPSVSPLADHRSQPIPAADSAAPTTETPEPESRKASSESMTELQGLTEKSDGRASSQGDGREQRQPHTALPPVRVETADAAAPGLLSRAAATAIPAEIHEVDPIATPGSSDTNSAMAIGQGLTSSTATVAPGVLSPALQSFLNPLEIAEQLATEVSRRVETSVVDGQERFTMRLDPPELGELVISMRRTASGIELHVEAADPATMNLIQNGIDQMKSDPERSGSVFQQLNIDVTTGGHGSGHPADQRRPPSLNGAAERATVDVSESTRERSESEQISFVA